VLEGHLIGPAGVIGVDDSEVLDFVQGGLRKSPPGAGWSGSAARRSARPPR
jgi:hypothetical protein